MKKYLVRSVKYCLYLAVILCLVIVILSLAGWVGTSVEAIFKNGWKSLGQIAVLLLVFAAIYPRFGFAERSLLLPGSDEDLQDGVLSFMQDRGYRLERTDGSDLFFRLRSPLSRLTRMFEDRISLRRTATGYEVEGPSKDIVRIVSGLDYRFHRDQA